MFVDRLQVPVCSKGGANSTRLVGCGALGRRTLLDYPLAALFVPNRLPTQLVFGISIGCFLGPMVIFQPFKL